MAPAIWGPNVTGGGTAHPYLPPGREKPPICRGLQSRQAHRNPSHRAKSAWLCGSGVPECSKSASGAVPVLSQEFAESDS